MTEQVDIYLAIIVAVMFVAGCFLTVFAARKRSQARKRWDSESGG
jgi:hypothetical protein